MSAAANYHTLLLLMMMWLHLSGCDTFTRQEGVASPYGKLYPYTSLSDCQKLCLEMTTCVAVDVSLDVCIVHTNISDMATTFNASGFTQYILNHACLPTTSTSTSSSTSTVSTATTTTSTHFGNCIPFRYLSNLLNQMDDQMHSECVNVKLESENVLYDK